MGTCCSAKSGGGAESSAIAPKTNDRKASSSKAQSPPASRTTRSAANRAAADGRSCTASSPASAASSPSAAAAAGPPPPRPAQPPASPPPVVPALQRPASSPATPVRSEAPPFRFTRSALQTDTMQISASTITELGDAPLGGAPAARRGPRTAADGDDDDLSDSSWVSLSAATLTVGGRHPHRRGLSDVSEDVFSADVAPGEAERRQLVAREMERRARIVWAMLSARRKLAARLIRERFMHERGEMLHTYFVERYALLLPVAAAQETLARAAIAAAAEREAPQLAPPPPPPARAAKEVSASSADDVWRGSLGESFGGAVTRDTGTDDRVSNASDAGLGSSSARRTAAAAGTPIILPTQPRARSADTASVTT